MAQHNGQDQTKGGLFARITQQDRLADMIAPVWFENANRDVAIPPKPDVAQRQHAPDGFDIVHVLQVGVIAHDTLRFEKDADEPQLIGRELHEFDQRLVEDMVRAGAKLVGSILMAAEACERCLNALRFEFRGVGYPVDSKMYVQNPARCRLCREEGRQLDSWFRGSYVFSEEGGGQGLHLAGD